MARAIRDRARRALPVSCPRQSHNAESTTAAHDRAWLAWEVSLRLAVLGGDPTLIPTRRTASVGDWARALPCVGRRFESDELRPLHLHLARVVNPDAGLRTSIQRRELVDDSSHTATACSATDRRATGISVRRARVSCVTGSFPRGARSRSGRPMRGSCTSNPSRRSRRASTSRACSNSGSSRMRRGRWTRSASALARQPEGTRLAHRPLQPQ